MSPKQKQPQAEESRRPLEENPLLKAYEFQNIDNITLLRHPFTTTYYFTIVIFQYLIDILKYILNKWYVLIIFALIIGGPVYIEGSHQVYVKETEQIVYFMMYWILLGVASSIGLGTGLHTFVLYLGPWIAKVTMVANDCKAIPPMIPNKWTFQVFADCPQDIADPISFLGILRSVQFEAFLWGFGTALGELPPYFVAKAARASQKKLEEIEEIKQIESKSFYIKISDETGIIAYFKKAIFNNLQKYGFLTVLLCASIPNPLFDLAGITCGHFGIPFVTFFTATAIGKSIIKMIFVIFIFSEKHVETFLQFIESLVPQFKHSLSSMMEKQRKSLHTIQEVDGPKPLIGQLWDYFITLMIIYFLYSIINSTVQGYLQDKKIELKKKNK